MPPAPETQPPTDERTAPQSAEDWGPPGPQPPEPQPDPPRPNLRNSREIQGNILAGFNKDHQTFVFVQLPDVAVAENAADGVRPDADGGQGDDEATRATVRPWLTELERQISATDEVATFNEQFSEARRARGGDDPEDLAAVWVNVSFTADGLQKLSPGLALPEGRFQAFREGALSRAASLGDTGESDPSEWFFGGPGQPTIDAILTVAADRRSDLVGKLRSLRDLAARHGVVTILEQAGETLPFRRAGHEHFGFKDGISQPGVRDFHEPATEDGRQDERKDHPGTKLVEPGEFVLGHPDEGATAPEEVPDWMHDGSFQVFRRLNQDVPGWWAQMRQAENVGLTNDHLAAKLVGRWRSGTPLAPSEHERDNRSARDSAKDNDFTFADDPEGERTPRFAHVRKLYPRGEFEDRRHRIMRRGIPFGRPFDPSFGRGHGVDAERGLLFNVYCADIERQFEFLQTAWANNPGFPRPEDGADPVIGADPVRVRLRLSDHEPQSLDFARFVHTRGAVYAFAPSKRTLRNLAAGEALE